jgi:hypothetical protein
MAKPGPCAVDSEYSVVILRWHRRKVLRRRLRRRIGRSPAGSCCKTRIRPECGMTSASRAGATDVRVGWNDE